MTPVCEVAVRFCGKRLVGEMKSRAISIPDFSKSIEMALRLDRLLLERDGALSPVFPETSVFRENKMLVRFTITNWMSFREKTEFSMFATRQTKFRKRVPLVKPENLRLLPVSAVYGGNASGKTNLFLALDFVRQMVLLFPQTTTSTINVSPFALSREDRNSPSSFSIALWAEGKLYEYSFKLDEKKIYEECLVTFKKSKPIVVFERTECEKYTFGEGIDEATRPLMKSLSEGTLPNALFLTNTVFQRRKEFLPIYNWFLKTLVLISSDTRFRSIAYFIDKSNLTDDASQRLIDHFDTGVVKIGTENIPLKDVPLPEKLKDNLKERLSMADDSVFSATINRESFLCSQTEEGISFKKMVTYHSSVDGRDEVQFDTKDESDGTLRLFELVPMLGQLMSHKESKVYFVDEIDRSCHYLVTKKLLELYLSSCDESNRSQLIFTTHDLLLMDQKLLRRDEMWITERNNGESSLTSIGEYQLDDKDNIRRLYLDNRFGGIPNIY